jgi:hypothetical protein
MFLYFASLNCDNCGDPFEKIAASAAETAEECAALAVELDLLAHQSGWFRYKDGITCDCCLMDIAFQREQSREKARTGD